MSRKKITDVYKRQLLGGALMYFTRPKATEGSVHTYVDLSIIHICSAAPTTVNNGSTT